MNEEAIKLTSSEIGSLWGIYVNGTAADMVNRYMLTIIEDDDIKAVFEEAIEIFAKQKQQVAAFLEKDGFPLPVGFTESADLNKNARRLFSDIFCLHYLHLMTTHGLLGHITALNSSVRKDLRNFYDACDDDGKTIYHKTTDLLLEKGHFQRDPYFFPESTPEFISGEKFLSGFMSDKRPLAATEMIALSLNIKKKIMQKALSIGFSQVAQAEDVRSFLRSVQNESDNHIQSLGNILHGDDLPVPMSWETEVTNSQEPPFSDKLMMFHMGFLMRTAQSFHGTGLSTAMRTDLAMTYEKIILKGLKFEKQWFNIMTKHKWLEQPPLAPDRKKIAKNRS